MGERIYLSSPDVGDAEEAALVRAIRSGWVAPMGPEVDAFEADLAAFCERKHAVALSSGSAALHLGLLCLGVGPGDVVFTSTMTFAATANAITYVGAQPVFIDCNETGNLNSESLGAYLNGHPASSYGIAAVLSFNGNKVMTTSGGGALVTDDAEMAARTRYLATQARQPVVHYEHTDIGYNYRLSNLLAALGRAQLARLDEMIERRRQIRVHYREFFEGVAGVSPFGEPSGIDGGPTRDNFWLTSILVDPEVAGFSAEDLRVALDAADIESRPMWKPMHLQPVFADAPTILDGTSERLFHQGLSLPSGSVLTDADLERIDQVILGFLGSRGV